MFKSKIEEDLKKVAEELGYGSIDIVCDIPKNPAFGDYTSNIPLQLANQKVENSRHSPLEIAKEIETRLSTLDSGDYLERVEVAGSGFLNFFIKLESLMANLHQVCDYSSFVKPELELEDDKKKILVEYASFNALKPVHVGHMRNIVLGEAITRLLESQGNEIFRVTYTSDIGLPAAKVVWALMADMEAFKEARNDSLGGRIDFLGQVYVKGHSAFEDSEESREEIKAVNKKIYERDPEVVKIWQEALDWTFEYFDQIYNLVGTKFDKQFLESEVEGPGAQIVRENIGKVFKEDQGAIIFPGEEFGLHNRVFISSAGNPTYEAKDMALANVQYQAFNFDEAIHVVAIDQEEYFKVIFKALEQLNPDLAKKEKHLSYGYVFLETGKKMSSRKGDVVTLSFVYEEIRKRIEEIVSTSHPERSEGSLTNVSSDKLRDSSASPQNDIITKDEKEEIVRIVSLGALKFSILKYSAISGINFDIEKSVSLQGDSGPYVQYSYARAKSVLRNAKYDYQPTEITGELEKEERELLRALDQFEFIVSKASDAYSPNTLAEYLLDLAKAFNLFYQKHQIISGEKADLRLALTCAVAVILKQGLYLLGIESPERM